MIADLKEKASGFDKKRLYTAAAALVIAGAAGHFMQRTANGPGATPNMITASVPASVVNPSPAPAAAPQPVAQPAPEALAEAAPAPAAPAAEPLPEIEIASIAEAPAPQPAPEPATAPVLAEAPAMPAENPAPVVEAAELAPEPAAPAIEVTRAASDPLLSLVEVEPEPAEAPEAPVALAAVEEPLTPFVAPMPPVLDARDAECAVFFSAVPEAGALVAISLDAPCRPGEAVVFDAAGLLFSEELGADGTLFIVAPVMNGDAVITATFSDGARERTEVPVPDFGDYERVAVVWQGATGLQLHALENGAAYGEPGHVWAEEPATVEAAIAGKGGFVSVLGSTADGYAADVYTYPARLMDSGAQPEISVEAQVMENTCGTKIEGTVLRSRPSGAPAEQGLAMAVPGCDAVGEYLVLKNLPQDLKLARN